MRPLLACLLAALPFAAVAAPSQDWSATIAAKGLGATEAQIAALPAPTPDDLFALAAVRFLTGVEGALQARWAVGEGEAAGFLPVFRLPLPANPQPAPFDPALVETTFTTLLARMEGVRTTLGQIPPDADFALPVRLSDLWFDVNRSAARDPGEGVGEIAGALLGLDPAADLPTVTFDRADAAWLSAYSHLLSGSGEAVLAFAPTGPITRVMEGRKALLAAGTSGPLDGLISAPGPAEAHPNLPDMAAMVLLTLRQTPDATRIHAARDHFLAMIADNRRLWSEVEAETDDHEEWIPNAQQKGVLAAGLPPEMGARWQAVLADGEKLLKGELLIPYVDEATGFDLGAWLEKPSAIDLVEWLHGMGLAPYLRKGPRISTDSWRAFDDLLGGSGTPFAFWLN